MTATEADARAPGTGIDLHRPQAQPSAIPAKIAYARALAESGLLPGAYRKNPGNILWAVEYGEMLGVPVMAAITGVHVIDGKPTASAGLISGLVRRAHHRLRVWGDNKSATCEITRSDDPKHPFTVTWTLRKEPGDNPSAELAGLLSKNTWKNYPAAMLKSRAITQCARDACEEALFGLHYTPEELGADVDEDGVVVPPCADGGTPEDDPWYGPEPAPDNEQPENGQRWAALAIEQAKAGKFKTEAEALKLWREAAEPGKCTPGQKDEIQNRVAAWIKARRREASNMALRQLPESAADWRAAVEGLNGDDIDACRETLEEIGRLKAAGTMNEVIAGRIGGAIIALCPKAAYAGDDSA